MKLNAIACMLFILTATGCVYNVRVAPPEISASENDTPSAAVFSIAQFDDAHPQKPGIGFTIQHCIMRYILVFGPIRHKPIIPLERLVPETLASYMKERGYNIRLLDKVVADKAPDEVPLPGETDYLVTGTIHRFYFSTPSADFVEAEIRVEWTGVVRDAKGQEIFRRKVDVTDKKLLGFGTNSFFNIEPFVRRALYKSMERFLESPELKSLLWRKGEPGR